MPESSLPNLSNARRPPKARRGTTVKFDRTWQVAAATCVGVMLLQPLAFPVPLGIWLRGLVLGLLLAMLAIGMALVHRANRIINFAQADLGIAPTSFATSFILFWGWPYLLGVTVGLAIAIVTGLVVEFVLIRRFRHSSRLIATVATFGVTQIMVVLGILIPRWWGRNIVSERIRPFEWKIPIGKLVNLNENDVIAFAVAILAIAGVATFLSFSRTGLAVRANAEHSERAAMLGLPVTRLNMIVWIVATVLSFLALFMRNGIIGGQLAFGASLPALMLALAALVIGRMERLPTIAVTATVFGLFEQCVRYSEVGKTYPIIAGIVFVALLCQPSASLRRDDSASSWRGVEEVRPLPAAARRDVAVKTLFGLVGALCIAGVVALPWIAGIDVLVKSTGIAIYAIILISIVVLTGWAGQISLGQMGFVGIGAAVGSTLTTRWNVDLLLACVVGGAVGAVGAFVVGLPALRLRGLYLAVTTFAFGLAATEWLLNDRFFTWFPDADQRITPLPLFGRVAIDTPTRWYFFNLAMLVIVVVAVRGVRRSRTGRVIVALRENERGAQAYAVPAVRTKLTAFILSGTIAGVGGVLMAHNQGAFVAGEYGPGQSLAAFTTAVVGGLGMIGGAILGALYQQGLLLIRAAEWQILTSAAGVLLVLLVLPSGLSGLLIRCRDVLVKLMVTPPSDEAVDTPTVTSEPAPEVTA